MTSKSKPLEDGIPFNFLGLAPKDSDPATARVIVLPVPYDNTVSYRPGARFGPASIIAASRQIELFDEETESSPYSLGIATFPEIETRVNSPEAMVGEVARVVGILLDQGKFVLTLGGEHTVSLGAFTAHHNRYPDLSVLFLDAHGDLRHEYQGSPYSHLCVARRIWERASVVHVGTRSLTEEGLRFLRNREERPFWARDIVGNQGWEKEVVSRLADKVYLSIDLDVLDLSIMPAVTTPEPGGLGWYEILNLVKSVAARRKIIGFDIVELAPIPGNTAPDFLAARLAYKILGYVAPSLSSREEKGNGD